MSDTPEGDEARAAARQALLDDLDLRFHHPALFDQALTHRSHTLDQELDPLESNERLEFLGDAVVQLVVSDWLYREHPGQLEGALTTLRAAVVRRTALSQAAARLALGPCLTLGHGAELTGGRQRSSILGSALEALFGAIYVDQGWEPARRIAERLLAPELAAASARQNHKSALQEYTQARFKEVPEYRVRNVEGPAHLRRFAVEVWVGGRCLGRGEAGSKKEAGQLAAAAALHALEEDSATSGC